MNIFDMFNQGRLCLPDSEVDFSAIGWSKHPVFDGVELKHIVTSDKTNGKFSFHLVRIAANKKIGLHVHEKQAETHEVISGSGICINNGTEILYKCGTVSLFNENTPHEVLA